MRTHSASSRASKTASSSLSSAEDGASRGEVEPYWLPWHIDPNTISTLTGDAFFDFGAAHTIELPEYPEEGLGLQLLNALGETVYVSKHIDDSSLVIMMAAGAQVHTGGLLRGCMHAVKRQAAPPGASRIMYYQAWYGPSAHKITPPPGSDYHPSRTTAATASNEIGRRVRAVVDPIVNAVYNRTQRTMLLDFRRQFQRLPVGNERDGSQAHFEALDAALPLGPSPARLTIDMITDLSCPLAYLGLKRLRAALAHLGLDEGAGVRLRFHAVFINPNMDMDGEEMGAYMRKRRDISLEEYNDDSYPLNAAARALNYAYDNSRRVINPRRAHLFVGAAGEEHHARVYEALAERYFEHGDDISDMDTLLALNGKLGLLMLERHGSCLNELMMRRAMDRAEGPLMNTYRRLDPLVEGVPHFLVREGVHGSGLELQGPVDVDTFIDALRRVDEARHAPPFGDSFGLQQPAGMVMPGFGGKPIPVPTVDRLGGASISAFNLHGWSGPESWPYKSSDFSRLDENDDALKYAAPNFGHHIDAPARAALSATYAVFFDSANPRRIGGSERRANLELLDLASSWTSHYPPLPNTTRVTVHGLNAFELGANVIAHRRDVLNLNLHPALPYADGSFNFVTMAASVGYLTRPREVFAEMNRVLKPGGVAIVSFTNRVFDEKATSLWLNNMDEEVALSSIVRNYFYFGPVAGWQNVTGADVSPHPTEGDPMWIVTAVKA
jgi:predicted DsbA family dithiol-disulfide isomerase/SAM-dependent methyltransferase